MTTITIPLSEDQLEQLTAQAREIGVAPEELARAGLEEWLNRPNDEFLRAARYALQKNAELCRRLA
jgi:hypothetical protein